MVRAIKSRGPRTSASVLSAETAILGRGYSGGLIAPPWNGTKPPNCGGALVSEVSPRKPTAPPPATSATPAEPVPSKTTEAASGTTGGGLELGVGVAEGAGVGASVMS